MINEHQRQLIEDKYGRLIHKIGHNISGDLAISSHSDNVQDLWVSVLEAIKGFEKKEGIPFEEFWGGTPFDKYLKTCLWNSKNSKGAKITKKYPITKHTVDIVDNAEVLALEAPYSLSTESTVFMDEVAPLFTEEQQEVILKLVEDPNYIKPCLWNSKNSKGAKITKKYPITKGVASISRNEEVLLLEDSAGACAESNLRMEEIPTLLSTAQQEVLEKLVEDPTLVKPSGKVNVQALAQDLGKSWYDTRTILNEIAQQLENEL